MASFVIYNSATGAIQGTYVMTNVADDAAIIAANTPSGASSLIVEAGHPVLLDQTAWRVQSGALVAYALTDAELLAKAQAAQSSLMDAAYQTQIDNGFTSSALGESYLYPGTAADQANLNAVITASMIPGQPADWTTLFWCAPSATPAAWNYISHTAPQIHQVGIDALNYIMAAKMRRATRNAQIQAAATVAAVQAITW